MAAVGTLPFEIAASFAATTLRILALSFALVLMLLSAMVAFCVDTRVGWREGVQKSKGWRALYVLGAASKERSGREMLCSTSSTRSVKGWRYPSW
jgi:hypothetical protein